MVVSGELTLLSDNEAQEKTVKAGEAFVGQVDTEQRAQNRGREPVDLILAYFGGEETPLCTQAQVDCESNSVAKDQNLQGVKTDTLFRTSKSWDEVELSLYPTEKPAISIIRFNVPPQAILLAHSRSIINFGEITVISDECTAKRTM